eukprot:CAMPEP_0194177412 /NCGR_PEP_ID=MMETSP0154-20130528/11154_1 /TAXON_ID=1049557 /ORGANISM="Thalassiothrix antarctica, Strain L6-D1" /LENGTH=48 /DNA_ID= /DNA_START= /DNA_END= /DNA_ORIENTATION=
MDGTIKVQWDEKFTKRLPVEKFHLNDDPNDINYDFSGVPSIFGDGGDY